VSLAAVLASPLPACAAQVLLTAKDRAKTAAATQERAVGAEPAYASPTVLLTSIAPLAGRLDPCGHCRRCVASRALRFAWCVSSGGRAWPRVMSSQVQTASRPGVLSCRRVCSIVRHCGLVLALHSQPPALVSRLTPRRVTGSGRALRDDLANTAGCARARCAVRMGCHRARHVSTVQRL